jgi:hypothetical protein
VALKDIVRLCRILSPLWFLSGIFISNNHYRFHFAKLHCLLFTGRFNMMVVNLVVPFVSYHSCLE